MMHNFPPLPNLLLLVVFFVGCHLVPTIRAGPSICNNVRRRLLPKNEWEDLLKSCSHVNYRTDIHVDKHVSVVAIPDEKSNSFHDDCPIVAMEHSSVADIHDQSGSEAANITGTLTKNINVVKLPTSITPDQLNLLHLGTFPFSKIFSAFEQSEVATGTPSEGYDIILANCGDFVAQMVTNLGLDWDIKSTDFIAERLHHTYGDLGQQMRDSPNIEQWFMDMQLDPKLINSASDLELVELLVESKTIHLYEDPNEGYQQRRRMLEVNDQVLDATTDDSMIPSRRLVECGQWYSSDCVAETDIRYDRDASNTITDQNKAWAKFDGFYEASATAYGPDGRVLEESFIPLGAQSFLPNQTPFSQAPYKVFINITLSGSRYYEQAYYVYPHAREEFCSEAVPEGMSNVLEPGECGWSGTSGFYERFGTSSFEKDGSVTMLPFGSRLSGTSINRQSYVSIPAGDSNHFGSYTEEGKLIQYTTACLDPNCNQMSTTFDVYDTTSQGSTEYTLLGSTRLLAKRIGSSQEFTAAIRAAYSLNNVPSSQQLELPMSGACLSGNCPTESDWCQYDPECAVSPYKEPEASVLAGPVIGFVIAIFAILFGVLLWWNRRIMAEKEAKLREKFASRIAESIKMQGAASLTPDKLAAEFERIDKDKGGTIEKEELWDFVCSGNAGNMSRSDFNLLFSVIDVDNSGSVDFKEFVVFFGKCGEEYKRASGRTQPAKKRQSVFEDAADKLTSKPDVYDSEF